MVKSSSAVVNRYLRRQVAALLRQVGFRRVEARKAWNWLPDAIWVLQIRAVGRYFADITGWPPSSVSVNIGVFYPFVPTMGVLKCNKDGRLLPEEVQCHRRGILNRQIEQRDRAGRLWNYAESERRDIWWVDPDGTNADEVADDIADVIRNKGLPWYRSQSNLELVLESLKAEAGSFNKYALATYIAEIIGQKEDERRFREQAEAEAKRIDRKYEPGAWFAVYGDSPSTIA